jgi:hypothetical protein
MLTQPFLPGTAKCHVNNCGWGKPLLVFSDKYLRPSLRDCAKLQNCCRISGHQVTPNKKQMLK